MSYTLAHSFGNTKCLRYQVCVSLWFGVTGSRAITQNTTCALNKRGLQPSKAKAVLVTLGERPTERKLGLDGHGWQKGRGRTYKKISNEPNNIGNNTFGNTSVRSRITPHVIHMHRSAQEKSLIVVGGVGR